MAATPRKLVHWEMDGPSISALDSPFFNNTYESSVVSTSSLEFINSQLVAHGFVPSPGLSLEGISNNDSTRVVKCLLGMLSQRVEDMSRTEDLTAKFRTLSYDHERMLSMYRTANEKAANAERETNLHKSRLTTALKNLQVSENAQKQTNTELQRTRTSLQGIRATHIAELKKKEKDVERLMEKWQKLADSQVKLSAAPSGMRCANVNVVEGSDILGRKCQGYLEIALEEAEQARASLGNETLHLRKLLLSTVNELQSIFHQAQNLLPDNVDEAPTPFTLTTFFPISPPTAASDKLSSVLAGLRQTLTTLSQPTNKTCASKAVPPIPDGELQRLHDIITTLKEEISRSQKQSMAHAAETQAMFDKFAKDHRAATGEIGEMSIELMSAPLRDEEKEKLDDLRQELDSERQRFTEAAVKFGREKAALEAERLKFLDEKRSWQVEMMLADFPPTPVPASPVRSATNLYKLSPKKSPHKSPHRSPRKSPAKKTCVGKGGSPNGGRRAHRVSKRSLASPSKVKFSYETELIPPIPAPSFPTVKSLVSLTSSLLPTSFVLPPPSPRASLPTEPALPAVLPNAHTEAAISQTQSLTSSTSSNSARSINHMPSTPPAIRRPFPMAKPFAPRMTHAYSPAKPSPLSRILMLSNSPLSPPRNDVASDDSLSPTSGPLAVVLEEVDDGGLESGNEVAQPLLEPEMSLAAELGVESPPDTPLQEKNAEPNVVVNPNKGPGQERVFYPDPNGKKPPAAQGKEKVKANPVTRPRTSAEEKENNSRSNQKILAGKSGKVSPAMIGGHTAATRKISPTNETRKPVAKSAATKPISTTAPTTTTRTKTFTKPPVPPGNNGGARRVLINSVDAPPMAKGRKG